MPCFEKAHAGSLALFSDASACLVVEARLMFGCPCRFVKGNMVAAFALGESLPAKEKKAGAKGGRKA
jgi:hypothetical protein